MALQRGLTGDRDLIGSSYMDENRRLASYLLFYWPVSYAQTRAMLRMAGISSHSRSARILDLGSGPAPCSLAAADHLGAENTSIVACDQSPLALETAGRLAVSSGYSLEPIARWNAQSSPLPDGAPSDEGAPPVEGSPSVEGGFDLIVIGHVLNELWTDKEDRAERRFALLEAAFSRLRPDGALLFLEPALLKTGREAIALRDRIAASGRRILAPCLRRGPCPALDSESQTCHSDFVWDVPPVVRELSRRTGLGKDLVKTTSFVASASVPAENAGDEYRVVSDPMVNKAGRVRYLICGESGRFPLSAKRGEGYPSEKAFFALKRSDRIALTDPVRRETGFALGPLTSIARR